MSTDQPANAHIATDADGFLADFNSWNRAIAETFAHAEHIELSAAHWEIVEALREFYRQYEQSPTMRPLVKYIGQQLGKEKGNSIYLLQLFPGSPAKLASKIAGLPRPENCL
ncbi:MAG TPA: TusE/DsrC/DsvC family sulfur relay protein [Spongiibacteraceae bacterium]|nr:TusE/DsrC/DsvC family sulfur relay protein [Spongiibacteraceae bacterium]